MKKKIGSTYLLWIIGLCLLFITTPVLAYEIINLDQEYPPDLSGPENAPGLIYENDGIYLKDVLETQYDTPRSEGGVVGIGKKTNNFDKISAMSIEYRKPGILEDKGAFESTFLAESDVAGWNNGSYLGTGKLPLTARIASGEAKAAKKDFMAGNYGAYIRIEFPVGVDAKSMAKCIEWKESGGSSKFDLQALGIDFAKLPFLDATFPITWYPQYTRYSEEDPNAIYCLMRGVNLNSEDFKQYVDTLTTPKWAINTLIDIGSVGVGDLNLGTIGGYAAGHLKFDMSRYEGNLSTEQLEAMGYDKKTNPEAFKGVDDSPGKSLTKHALPPDPSNKYDVKFNALDRLAMLSPELTKERSDKYQMEDAYFDKNKLLDNQMENNAIDTWSTYFSPIDSVTDPSDKLDESKRWNFDPNKSFNTKKQLADSGKYVDGEFKEVENSNYTMVLPGDDYKNRELELNHHHLNKTYQQLTTDETGKANYRFARVIDFFNKTDITNDPSRQVNMTESFIDENGDIQPISELNKKFNHPYEVYFNGTSTASEGGEKGKINANSLTVNQTATPPKLKIDKTTSDSSGKLYKEVVINGTVSSLESEQVSLYVSINDGEYTKIKDIDTNRNTGDPSQWSHKLTFDKLGIQKVKFKAVDKLDLSSTEEIHSISIEANQYPIQLNYQDVTGKKIHDSEKIQIDDTQLKDNVYSLPLEKHFVEVPSYVYQHTKVDESDKEWQISEKCVWSREQLETGKAKVTYIYRLGKPQIEVPQDIDFGTHSTSFEKQQMFPKEVTGRLNIKNVPEAMNWQLYVSGDVLTQAGKPTKAMLSYFKSGTEYTGLETGISVYSFVKGQQEPEEVELSKDWTLAKSNQDQPANGFTLNTNEGMKGNYQTTLNWTVVQGVDQ